LDAASHWDNLFLELIFNTIINNIHHVKIDKVYGQLRLDVEVQPDDEEWDEWGTLKFSVQVIQEREEGRFGYNEFVVIGRHQGNPEQFREVEAKIKWTLGNLVAELARADTPVYRGEEFED
jgi:hypothetical protein